MAEGLRALGLPSVSEPLQLTLAEGRTVWGWGLEAQLVAPLRARGEALEKVVDAQAGRIALGEAESSSLRRSLSEELRGSRELQAGLREAKNSAERERIKGKLKLYGGVAIGLGAGWLIFHH